MSGALRSRDSPQNHLHAAICLLGLITARPANLEELFKESEVPLAETTSVDNIVEDDPGDLENVEIGSTDDGEKRDLYALRSKVLDRLAETLARYKSNPKAGKGAFLDSKHVSSTMMIISEDESKVKILCAKNEGLDQGKSTEDTDFLNAWKTCMEDMSRADTTVEEGRAYMFDLVLKYQQPRISYYVEKLRQAFRIEKLVVIPGISEQPVLSDSWLRRLPDPGSRIWIDDSGNEFKFLSRLSDDADNNSRVALSAQSLKHVEDEVAAIFSVVDKLIALNIKLTDYSRLEALLKELLPTLYLVWKSARFQALMKSQLHLRFQHSQYPQKRQSEAMTALRFLCRCYYSVETFVEAAKALRIFHNIEWIPVPVPPKASRRARAKAGQAKGTPLEIAKILGVYLRGNGWTDHLEKQTTKTTFKQLQSEMCHVHAEIQVLHYQNIISSEEQGKVHPYIGCSKRCCLLCWLFIRIHGWADVRGCHETLLHRWEIPVNSLAEPVASKFQSISNDLFGMIKYILQNMFDQSFPLQQPKLLAQSSAALSTTKTVLDREKAEMEKSQLRMRQIMMGQFVANDNVLIVDNPSKPGFVSVMGGSLTKLKEMTCYEAEIYRENHIRGKFGLGKSDQMRPKQSSIGENRCRRCRSPSYHHCSACRIRYCSRICQKKDWRRHLFICTIRDRPNYVDYLNRFLKRWSHSKQNASTQEQFFSDLYSDDHLCKTFGFNNCFKRCDVANLLCFYGHMTSKLSTKGVQAGVEGGSLGDYMEIFAQLTQHDREDSYRDCPCFAWFLAQRSAGLEIPNWEASYAYQITGLRQAEHALSIDQRDDETKPLSEADKEILRLYSVLFRDFNNIPGPLNSHWFEFGFCFCTDHAQRKKLAKLYLQLVKKTASIEEIADAYESESLSLLMMSKGLDISFFEAKGILFHRPELDERGIYRLIAETNHTLSGRFCYCFVSKSHCHPKFETHLSHESDGDYGFHGTNTWERWQLFNFYKYVFDLPGFNAREMQEAKRDSDRDKLGQYLESLVPNFQKKISNWVLADVMFPKLKACVRFPNGRPECRCVMHDTVTPEGLNWATLLVLSQLRRMFPEAKEIEFEEKGEI